MYVSKCFKFDVVLMLRTLQMQHVRSFALSGGISDAQRKENAAAMAMRLFELMGGADDEDEEDDT